jgi:RimJ/RimL family protein N-acetyltransferase
MVKQAKQMPGQKNRLAIRVATPEDAKAVTEIVNSVVEEKRFTTFSKMSHEEGRQYIKSMAPRERIFVAELGGKVVGFQFFEKFPGGTEANRHVATMGTFLFKGYRRRGIGTKLARTTFRWAKDAGFEKIVVWVFEDNIQGLRFYEKLGFRRVGKWTKQVKIDDEYHDEILLEKFL